MWKFPTHKLHRIVRRSRSEKRLAFGGRPGVFHCARPALLVELQADPPTASGLKVGEFQVNRIAPNDFLSNMHGLACRSSTTGGGGPLCHVPKTTDCDGGNETPSWHRPAASCWDIAAVEHLHRRTGRGIASERQICFPDDRIACVFGLELTPSSKSS